MSLKKILQAAALCSGLIGFGGAGASVITFNNVNDTGAILYSTTQDGATLSAIVQFTLSAISNNSATFALSVSNNSSGPGTNSLMSFGIDTVSPILTGASATGAWEADISQTLPTFQTVDLCIWRSNGCTGGAVGDGLGEGLSDIFSLVLTTAGNFQADGISFTSPYGVKFQNTGTVGNSAEFAGCIAGTTGCGPTTRQLPEPASIALVGLALLGIALGRRRRA